MKILLKPEVFWAKDFLVLYAIIGAYSSPTPCNHFIIKRRIFDAIYWYKFQIQVKCGSLDMVASVGNPKDLEE